MLIKVPIHYLPFLSTKVYCLFGLQSKSREDLKNCSERSNNDYFTRIHLQTYLYKTTSQFKYKINKPAGARKTRGGSGGEIINQVIIGDGPMHIQLRNQVAHLEGDLVICKDPKKCYRNNY